MARLTSLGKYELIKRIAVGGMSEIFLASQRGLDGFERAVIVKCIREDLDTDEEVKQMFLDEARIAACLKHPNIVHLYDVGRIDEAAYLAMEYVFGRDLLEIGMRLRLQRKDFPLPVLIKIICDVLAGLHYAHFVAEFEDQPLRVIHRDVSPQNILVSFDGVAKLVDFGIAKASARLSETRAGILKGKYAYMSPEQVRGKPLDHRSDQFSLAVVLYEALTGTRLFQRDTDYSTMEAVDRCDIPPLRVLRRDVPRRLARVLRKAMQRNPKRRFATCRDMERALHRLLRGSAVEKTERVATFLRHLFTDELKLRERAIADSDGRRHDLLVSSGFEMLEEKSTQIGLPPEAPLAQQRYKQILAEREGVPTVTGAPIFSAGGEVEQTDLHRRATDPVGAQKLGLAKLLRDWRFLVLAFFGALLLALFVLTTLGEHESTAPSLPSLGEPRPISPRARPGIDGLLSVSVSPRVEVIIDGRSLGRGAFRQHPLQAGVHQVELVDKDHEIKNLYNVRIDSDREFLLAPEQYQ